MYSRFAWEPGHPNSQCEHSEPGWNSNGGSHTRLRTDSTSLGPRWYRTVALGTRPLVAAGCRLFPLPSPVQPEFAEFAASAPLCTRSLFAGLCLSAITLGISLSGEKHTTAPPRSSPHRLPHSQLHCLIGAFSCPSVQLGRSWPLSVLSNQHGGSPLQNKSPAPQTETKTNWATFLSLT